MRKLKVWARFFLNNYILNQRAYSQLGEDMVMSQWLDGIKKGFYVEIGSHDPMFSNNTYFFYKKGWSGVCVEPDPDKCQLIKAIRRRDTVVNAAIAPTEGMQKFYIFKPDAISTLVESSVEAFKKLGFKVIGERMVKTMPLKSLLERYAAGRDIDILSVDAEGYDMEILQSNDWEKFRPKLVMAEILLYRQGKNIRVSKEFDAFFQSHNYMKIADSYLNGIYLDKIWAEKQGLDA
jgi:FkbM family methyltransferase